MNTDVYIASYVGVGAFVLSMSHLIRSRLKAKHPQIYVKLGSPGFNDSNLGPTYWKFSGFVWWGHFTDVRDSAMHALCLVTVLGEIGVLVLFAYQFAVIPSVN
jgi:hypothetical protein